MTLKAAPFPLSRPTSSVPRSWRVSTPTSLSPSHWVVWRSKSAGKPTPLLPHEVDRIVRFLQGHGYTTRAVPVMESVDHLQLVYARREE